MRLEVENDETITIKGKSASTITGDLTTKSDAKITTESGSDMTIKAGTKLAISASQEITLTVGGSSIKISSSGIEIRGMPKVEVKGAVGTLELGPSGAAL